MVSTRKLFHRPLSILSSGLLTGITIISAFILSSSPISAVGEDVTYTSTSANASVVVSAACTMTGSGMNTHTAEIPNGTYRADIGATTIKVVCNDPNGFSIYAIGFSNDEYTGTNHTKLVGTSDNTKTIATGTATSGSTSNWAMKLATNSSATYPITPTNGYGSYSNVPDTYTKVAQRTSGTDVGTGATGSELTTTYAAFVSSSQPADTYVGKVKYTMVHPYDAPEPGCTTPVPNLTYMQDLNTSNKSSILASMIEDKQYFLKDARDEKTYCVSKLRDGNIWMTQNLDHDIDSSKTYTPQDTDISSDWTPSLSTYDTDDKTWNSSYTTLESYDPGNIYWNGAIGWYSTEAECVAAGGTWNSNNNRCNLIASTGDSHHHFGNYYNWTAAVALNDSSSYTTHFQDLNQSICPANWTLPKSKVSTSSGSFEFLLGPYGWNSSSHMMENPSIWDTAVNSSLGGEYWNGELQGVGTYGFWWSPVVDDGGTSYGLRAYSYGSVLPDSGYSRCGGLSIRCIAR